MMMKTLLVLALAAGLGGCVAYVPRGHADYRAVGPAVRVQPAPIYRAQPPAYRPPPRYRYRDRGGVPNRYDPR